MIKTNSSANLIAGGSDANHNQPRINETRTSRPHFKHASQQIIQLEPKVGHMLIKFNLDPSPAPNLSQQDFAIYNNQMSLSRPMWITRDLLF